MAETTTTALGGGWELRSRAAEDRDASPWLPDMLVSPDGRRIPLIIPAAEMLRALAGRVAELEAQVGGESDVLPFQSQQKRLAVQLGRPPEDVINELRAMLQELTIAGAAILISPERNTPADIERWIVAWTRATKTLTQAAAGEGGA